MPILLRIAWRNLWRQPRRTWLTVSAMAVGIGMCMAMFAIIDGVYARMFDVLVGQALGHVQVHHPAWPADQQLYDTVPGVDEKLRALDALPGVKAVGARLSCAGLAAGDETSSGALFLGVDPSREEALVGLRRRVVRGAWLDEGPANAAVIGAGLAKELELEPGGELVLITQAADGSIGNALFTVVGVVETGSALRDRSGVWTRLPALQEALALPDQAHELIVLGTDIDGADALRDAVAATLAGPALLTRSWWQASPPTAQMINSQAVGKGMVMLIVFSVAGLGVLNTMLMNVFERTRELGVLKAIGLSPQRVMALVMLEAGLIGVVSSAAGLTLGLLIDLYLVKVGIDMSAGGKGLSFGGVSFDPVIRGVVNPDGVWAPVVFVVLVSLIAAVWPGLRAARLQPVDAMRQR